VAFGVKVRRLFGEPLVQFMAIGIVVFLLFPQDRAGPVTEVVEIGQPVVDRLAAQFEATWTRPPTEAELAGLIESHVREEILYREALALGLDRDDPVIRQRLQLKMEYIAEAAAAAQEPAEAELAAWYADHAAEFTPPALLSFDQVMLADRGEAAAVRAALAAGADVATLGRATILPVRIEGEPAAAVDGLFGPGFFAAVAALPEGEWAGPVESAFGVHLVRLTGTTVPAAPPLAEVREMVLSAWRAVRAGELRDEQYEQLRESYEIRLPGAAE
jgi:hypothetical protein